MAEVIDFDAWRKRKLDEAQAEWEMYMDKAAEFHEAGKHAFATEMSDKAKVVRKRIIKLRGDTLRPPVTHYVPGPGAQFSYSFSGADMGHPKVAPMPPPSPTPIPDNGC